ncbi:chemokine XC receptor 1-like [Hoplias malabaricus]|uniref:chemokine XC receptor 1-like n=1 Tax=Hoplias malabaricus TaxID=27720 RepID=UPI003462271A
MENTSSSLYYMYDEENTRLQMYDYYYDNETDEICDKETVVRVGSIAIPIFFTIVIILSLIGNVMVLLILILYESLKSLTNLVILNLAVSDLMFTLGLPFWACYYIWGWIFGDAVCKGVNFVFFVGFYSSMLFLMLLTIQRYVAVVHPLFYRGLREKGPKVAIVPVLAWVVSAAAAIPASVQISVMSDPNDSSTLHCEFNSTTTIIAVTIGQNCLFVVAVLVMAFCYIRIVQTVHKCRTKKKHRTIKLIFCIVAVFFVGWAPYNIVIFLQSLVYYGIQTFTDCIVSDHLDYSLYVFKLLTFSHCCLNPMFYVFVGKKFRNHVKTFLQIYFFS